MEDAEDALVDALVKAYQASDQLRDDEAFKGWLAIIARRACFKIKNRDSILKLVPLGADDPADPQEKNGHAESFALKDCVKGAIDSMPAIYRDVYVMCEIEDTDLKVAAKKLGLGLPALKSRLHRARERAREEFDRSLCM